MLLPAVDIAETRVAWSAQRQVGGTASGAPLDDALARPEGGADWVHLVDLDAAFGRGSNLDLLREVCAATSRPVIASGGVDSLDELRAIAGLVAFGVKGAIVGKALYAGAFMLRKALAATR